MGGVLLLRQVLKQPYLERQSSPSRVAYLNSGGRARRAFFTTSKSLSGRRWVSLQRKAPKLASDLCGQVICAIRDLVRDAKNGVFDGSGGDQAAPTAEIRD
jgi:hypothetical protein